MKDTIIQAMKKRLRYVYLFLILLLSSSVGLRSQCTTANLNWDNLEFLLNAGNYSGFVSTTLSYNQSFALGTNRLTMAVNSNITITGKNTAHTGESGGYGTGADIQFSTTSTTSRTIIITFDAEVTAFKMSIFDVDNSQRFTVLAENTGGTDRTVTLSKPSGGSVSFNSNPGTLPRADGASGGSSSSSNTGTVNIDVALSVKTITLTFSNAAGDFWFSDINACVVTNFPATYYNISRPFTGMPGYVLSVVNNNVYFTNTVSGVGRLLFTDPGNTYINSLAYDPYNRFLYYTYSLTGSPSTDKALKKYDVNTGTISTVLADVTTIGVPVFDYGVESGAAGFYNGSLFLGIEGYNDDFDEGKMSMVWRIDFNANVPYRSCQVYASLADDGSGNILHDWSDIGCSNGILYDFDGAASNEDFNVFNMQTGVNTNYNPSGSIVGRQVAIGWDEKVYNIDGTITQYNLTNGHTGSTYTITSTPAIPGGGSWGDAAEAFRPFLDFGDAPATYDPGTGDPAVHDSSRTTLRLGANINVEWLKTGVTSTNDSYDDGLAFVPVLNRGHGDYLLRVAVYNNTGANATLCGWLDYAATLGVFSAAEGRSVTVPSSASIQYVYLYWTGISTTLTNGSFTYLRLRLTSATNGMTTSNPVGFYANGEVEDYRVLVDNYPLKADLLSFNAKAMANDNIELKWNSSGEENFLGYEVQRSADNLSWEKLDFVNAKGNGVTGEISYSFNDHRPFAGRSYYRLKLISMDDKSTYSEVRSVTLNGIQQVTLLPNPATDKASLLVNISFNATASVLVSDLSGRIVYKQTTVLYKGFNTIDLPVVKRLGSGMYLVKVEVNNEFFTRKLIVKKE